MQPKSVWQSKTMWLNIAAAALVGLEAATGALQPVFGNHGLYTLIAGALPIANMILRGMTTQPIGKPETKETTL